MMVRYRNLSHCEKGFTIIEIIGVILLIGIVAAVVFPTFQSSNIDVATAASTIQSDINFVQDLALSRDPSTAGSIGITFTVGSGSYTITDPGGAFTQTRTLPSSVTVTQGGTISFNKYGEPEFPGSSMVFTINAGGTTQTLTVEQYTGRVTIT